MMKKDIDMATFQDEINLLKTLDHPNILRLYEYFIDDKYIHLVTELCTGGELFDKIVKVKSFEEKVACGLFK